jgi:hypothetical protein
MSAEGRTRCGHRPGRTRAGTPNPTQNRRYASASGAPGRHPRRAQAGLYQGRARSGRPQAGRTEAEQAWTEPLACARHVLTPTATNM